jgi:hypothetical protein
MILFYFSILRVSSKKRIRRLVLIHNVKIIKKSFVNNIDDKIDDKN